MKVVIAGGTGFLGQALVKEFSSRGDEVVVLSRSGKAAQNAKSVQWDGKTVGDWAQELEGAEAVLNMAGEDVFTRWSQSKRERILTSRVEPTQAIARAIEKAKRPPAVWVNASAVGYYGSTGDKPVDETSPAGADRLAEVCKQWESAQTDCLCPETKLSTIRIGFVLGRGGGAFPLLRRLTKLLLGSALGSGKQWVPWIHVDDVARIFALAVDQRLEGPLNAVGPYPVTNAQLMTELRKQMRRPWAPNVPKPVLSLGALIKLPPTEVTLASQRALPGRLQTLGFDYKFPTLESALADLLA